MEELIFGLGLAMKLLSLYFFLIALFALKRPKPLPEAAPVQRFAVVVAARNEESVIGALVASLRAQDYPQALFDIFVVPNNCTDDTAGAAAAAGAQILRPLYPVRCKGDALHQAFQSLLEEDYDAFVVFDADNVVDPGFLREMNRAFCAGARVAKGRNEAANPGDSWVAGCYGIYFSSFNLFFNRARAACGLSAKLIGTGFAVHRSVLEELGGWNTETIAEDAEFAAQCARAGHRVWWVPEAVAWDEEPRTLGQSMVQRKRWCSGVQQVARRKLPTLLRGGAPGSRPLRWDLCTFLLTPFAQALSLVALLLTFVCALIGVAGTASLTMALLMLPLSYLGTALLALAVCALSGKLRRAYLAAIFTFPLFMVTWAPLQLLALFVRTTRWEQIRHSGSLQAAA